MKNTIKLTVIFPPSTFEFANSLLLAATKLEVTVCAIYHCVAGNTFSGTNQQDTGGRFGWFHCSGTSNGQQLTCKALSTLTINWYKLAFICQVPSWTHPIQHLPGSVLHLAGAH